MLSPFLVLKGAFLALKNNFLIIITAFSVLFCVFSFLLLIDSLASAFFISSVIDTVPNINLLRFKEVAFLPSSLMSTLAFFALFLPLVLGAERMALMWVKVKKPTYLSSFGRLILDGFGGVLSCISASFLPCLFGRWL